MMDNVAELSTKKIEEDLAAKLDFSN